MEFHELHEQYEALFGVAPSESFDALAEQLYEAGIDPNDLSDHELQMLDAGFDGSMHTAEPLILRTAEPKFGAGRCCSCGGSGKWWTAGSGTRSCPNCGGSGVA